MSAIITMLDTPAATYAVWLNHNHARRVVGNERKNQMKTTIQILIAGVLLAAISAQAADLLHAPPEVCIAQMRSKHVQCVKSRVFDCPAIVAMWPDGDRTVFLFDKKFTRSIAIMEGSRTPPTPEQVRAVQAVCRKKWVYVGADSLGTKLFTTTDNELIMAASTLKNDKRGGLLLLADREGALLIADKVLKGGAK